jgi:hypothetical protein
MATLVGGRERLVPPEAAHRGGRAWQVAGANLLAPQWRDVGLAAVWTEAAPGEFGGRDVFLVRANFGSRS